MERDDAVSASTPSGGRRGAAFGLPATVWFLGLGSLLNDTASEAIYPLLPLFLTTVLGAGAFSLGVIEGAAEGINSVLKIFSGYVSDRWNRRRPVVVAGYAVAAVVRPFISLIRTWPQLFLIRFLDRIGKGVRTAPRDAMLAAWATPATRGRVFGFHRAMDHVGAVLGPSLATVFLLYYPGRYRLLFAMTIVPGLLAVLMVALGRERERAPVVRAQPFDARRTVRPESFDAQRAVRPEPVEGRTPPLAQDTPVEGRMETRTPFTPRALSPRFYRYLAVLLLFALGNSSDAFLLLRLGDAGVPAFWIPLLWALHHVVKAAVSIYGGNLSDRWSRRSVIGIGWAIYALVYFAFALSQSITALVSWFLVYGIYYGFSEGVEKALVADFAPVDLRGTAFGLYNAAIGAGALAASLVFGAVWKLAGAPAAFAMGASLALAATVGLFVVVGRGPAESDTGKSS